MEKYSLKITWKHTIDEFDNLTFAELQSKINNALAYFDDVPNWKVEILILKEDY